MEERKSRLIIPRHINLSFIIIIACYLGGSFAVSFVISLIRKSNPGFGLSVIQSLVLSQVIIWCGLLLSMLIMKRNFFLKTDFKFKSGVGRTVATMLLVVVFTLCAMPVVVFLNLVTMMFAENQVSEVSNLFQSYSLVVQLIFMAVMPAISEELVCRGALYGGLKRHSVMKGAIISALFFGVLHLNINQFAYATVLGLLFCFLNEATGNIYSSMLAHFVVNGTSVTISHFAGATVMLTAQTQQTTQQISNNVAEWSLGMKIMSIMIYGFLAMVGLIFVILLLWAISAINGRTANLKGMFSGKFPNPYAVQEVLIESEDGMDSILEGSVQQPKKYRCFDLFFWISMAIGFGYMMLEFII